MKKLLLIFILFSAISINAQWKIQEDSGHFDEIITGLMGVGYDGKEPYTDPILIIKKKDSEYYYIGLFNFNDGKCRLKSFQLSFGDDNTLMVIERAKKKSEHNGFFLIEKTIINQVMDLIKLNPILYIRTHSCPFINEFKIDTEGAYDLFIEYES